MEAAAKALYSDAFYKSKDGYWVLMRNRTDDGLRCSVSYIANDWLYAIHGPGNADEAKRNAGQIWFSGKAIPAPAGKAEQVELFVRAMKDKTATFPAALTKVIPEHGTFILFLNVRNYLRTVVKKGEDSDEFAVDLRGKQVYAAKLPPIAEGLCDARQVHGQKDGGLNRRETVGTPLGAGCQCAVNDVDRSAQTSRFNAKAAKWGWPDSPATNATLLDRSITVGRSVGSAKIQNRNTVRLCRVDMDDTAVGRCECQSERIVDRSIKPLDSGAPQKGSAIVKRGNISDGFPFADPYAEASKKIYSPPP